MANLSDVDSELLALAHKDARRIMNRCDELIERVEKELSKFVAHRRERQAAVAAFTVRQAGHLTDLPPGPRRSAANAN